MRVFGLHSIRFPTPTAHSIYVTRISSALANKVPLRLYVDRDRDRFTSFEKAWEFYSLVPPKNLSMYLPRTNHKGIAGVLRRMCIVKDLIKYRNQKPLIVHTTQPRPALTMTYVKKLLPFKFFVTLEVHQFEPGLPQAARRADAFMATTRDIENDLRNVYHCTKPILRIGHTIDVNKYKNTPLNELPQEPFKLGYMGNLYWWKGIDTIIESMTRLPENVHLKIVGGDVEGKNYKKIVDWAKEHKVDNRIEFTGFVPPDRVTDNLSDVHVLILPLKYQKDIKGALPQKLLEYMAMERPVIATNLPGILDIAHHEKNALVYKESDAGDLAGNIRLLQNDRKLQFRLARNARKTAAEYDEPIVTERIINFWSSLK